MLTLINHMQMHFAFNLAKHKNSSYRTAACAFLFLGDINNEITRESVAKHKCQLITDGTGAGGEECRQRSETGAENGL